MPGGSGVGVPAFNVKGLWELYPHFSVPGVSCILELYPLEHSHMVSGTSLRSVYGVVGNGRTRVFYPCYKKSTSYSLNGCFLHCSVPTMLDIFVSLKV